MNLGSVMQEVADRLDTIDGLRVFAYPLDGTPPVPAAIVTYPDRYVFDETYVRGMDRIELPVVVLVGRVYDRVVRDQIAKYLDGSGLESVKETLEKDRVYHVGMPGGVGDYISTPDAAALDITGDIDLRAKVRMNDWTPAVQTWLISKAPSTGVQRAYGLVVNTAGSLNLTWYPAGTSLLSEISSVVTGFADGTTHWVRATLDVDNGGGDAEVRFYTSDDGVTWEQLGTTQTVGAPTSIHPGTEQLELGGRTGGTNNLLAGRFYEAEIRNGIDGAVVTRPAAVASGMVDAVGGLVYTQHGNVTTTYDETLDATYTAFDTLRVMSVEFDVVRLGTVDYLAATLTLDIAGQGAP